MTAIFRIVYFQDGMHTVPLEAADLETARKAANQWRVIQSRITGKRINRVAVLPAKPQEKNP